MLVCLGFRKILRSIFLKTAKKNHTFNILISFALFHFILYLQTFSYYHHLKISMFFLGHSKSSSWRYKSYGDCYCYNWWYWLIRWDKLCEQLAQFHKLFNKNMWKEIFTDWYFIFVFRSCSWTPSNIIYLTKCKSM